MDVSTEQHAIKFCVKLNKLKVEMITLLKNAFQILVVSIVETWTALPELWNRCTDDAGNADDLWTYSRSGVWNHHKKWFERKEECFAAIVWYFKKENVKCMALESEDDGISVHTFLAFFGGVCTTVFTKPSCNSRTIWRTDVHGCSLES